jgi:hypothetical protein
LFTGCKKDKDQATVQPVKTDWAAILKNSVWSGEIQYTDGPILYPQYCSFIFGNDNTVRIADARTFHDAIWSVVDSTVTFEFQGSKRIAEVGKERWKYFENSFTFQYNFLSVVKSAAFDPVAQVGTTWKGMFYGKSFQIEFLVNNNLKITHPNINGGLPVTTPYLSYGSGISFGTPFLAIPIGVGYFGCLYNGNEIRGLSFDPGNSFFIYWKVTKQ